MTDKKLQQFIDDYRSKVADLEKKKHAAYFDAAVTGEEKYYQLYEQLEVAHTRLLSDRESFIFLASARDNTEDSLLKRQAGLLYNIYQAHQVPAELQEEIIHLETKIANQFSVFRAEVGGKKLTDNEVEELLETTTDSKKAQEAWEASKEVGSLVEEDVKRLVKLRNQAAEKLGYANYHQMSLVLSEQSPEEVNALFDHLDALTRDGFSGVKDRIDQHLADKFKISVSDLRPWHYQDRFFQEAPKITEVDLDAHYANQDLVKLTADYFGDIDLPVDDLLAKSDLFERPGKNQHAFCIHIDRYGDVRVLCNIKPNRKWMNTMLHEYGHAVYEKFYAPDLPFVLREPAHIFTTEAVAMFFGRLASNPRWMQAMGILDKKQADKIAPLTWQIMQTEQLVFSRWAQVMYRFEQALYANPDQDLNKLWWRLVEKYQGLTPPDDMTQAHWASKIHVATAPCYYHNYLLGELLASQFYAYLDKHELSELPDGRGYAGEPDIGRFFKEKVFAPGATFHWKEMIRKATGSGLDPKFYAEQFAYKS